jgi:hypothetical protein
LRLSKCRLLVTAYLENMLSLVMIKEVGIILAFIRGSVGLTETEGAKYDQREKHPVIRVKTSANVEKNFWFPSRPIDYFLPDWLLDCVCALVSVDLSVFLG